jgi:hypothetical protein
MNYIEQFQKYNNLVDKDIYHSKIGASNILFIGGCRSFVYAIFFEELCKYVPYFKHAQFGFAAIGVHIMDIHKRTKTNNLTYVIENADYIVCEQIRNYNILNTCENCQQNIFNTFNIKKDCKIIQIPNLEFKYYIKEIDFSGEIDLTNIELIKQIKHNNLTKYIEHLKKYKFYNLSTYFENNINTKRFFIQMNHPCNHFILELFKELIEILFQHKLSDNIITILKKIKIFDNDPNKTPILDIDYILGIDKNVK